VEQLTITWARGGGSGLHFWSLRESGDTVPPRLPQVRCSSRTTRNSCRQLSPRKPLFSSETAGVRYSAPALGAGE